MIRKSLLLEEKVVSAIDKKLAYLGGLDFSAYLRHLIAEDLKNPAEEFLKKTYAAQFSNRQPKLSEAEMIGIRATVESLFLCREIVAEMKDEAMVKRCAKLAEDWLREPLERAAAED